MLLDPDFATTVRTDEYYVFVEPDRGRHRFVCARIESQGHDPHSVAEVYALTVSAHAAIA